MRHFRCSMTLVALACISGLATAQAAIKTKTEAATNATYRPFNLKIAAINGGRDSLASSALLLNSLASVRSSPWVLRSKQFSASFVHLSANC